MSGSFIILTFIGHRLFLTTFMFPGMVQVSGEFPASRLLSAGHMGPSSVAFLFGFLSSDVLAALVLWSAARGGSVA
ncbi:hypothetical protein BDD12DRAFT_395434 [Trichophaea hybrida]|nr:hypothetical protein BDD12DRAFT_395434 [Trichophaea hybrida]